MHEISPQSIIAQLFYFVKFFGYHRGLTKTIHARQRRVRCWKPGMKRVFNIENGRTDAIIKVGLPIGRHIVDPTGAGGAISICVITNTFANHGEWPGAMAPSFSQDTSRSLQKWISWTNFLFSAFIFLSFSVVLLYFPSSNRLPQRLCKGDIVASDWR